MRHFSFRTMVVMVVMAFAMSIGSFANTANTNYSVAYASNNASVVTANTQDAAKKDAAIDAFLMMNEIRKENGLNMLSWNDDLGPATLTRAQEATILWSHTRPDGSDWYTVNPDLCYGENLANGYTTAKNAVNAWMASPEHKANILSSEFTSGNIQIVENSDGTWYWAEEFC